MPIQDLLSSLTSVPPNLALRALSDSTYPLLPHYHGATDLLSPTPSARRIPMSSASTTSNAVEVCPNTLSSDSIIGSSLSILLPNAVMEASTFRSASPVNTCDS